MAVGLSAVVRPAGDPAVQATVGHPGLRRHAAVDPDLRRRRAMRGMAGGPYCPLGGDLAEGGMRPPLGLRSTRKGGIWVE